jgi:hypothetical protein
VGCGKSVGRSSRLGTLPDRGIVKSKPKKSKGDESPLAEAEVFIETLLPKPMEQHRFLSNVTLEPVDCC